MAIGSNPIRSPKRKELVAAKATVQNKLQNRSLVYATQLTSQAKRAIVDSGANTMLMALDTPLEGGGEGSKRKCWDFTGQKYVPMAKQGHVWMCFTDPNADSTDQSQGSHLLKVYTQTAAQITDNILSVSRMVKLLGFELRFRPTGWEGFTKKDPSTGNYIKIPVFYDADDMLWYIYFSVGSTRRRAMQNARTDDGVQRQVVDVTGSEWTPDICYAGNAMLRRSRRIQSKEQIIGDITAEQNTGKILKDGTSTVPQITGKRPRIPVPVEP